jgi:ATP-dependent DNA helicase RecG
VQKGKGSATHYLPAERLGLNKNTSASPGLSIHLEGLSGNPSALSSNLGSLSSNPTALSSNPQPNAQDAARSNLLDELPGSLAARLGGLGQRHPPQEIQNLIVDLCSLRDWSVSELALLLRRNPEGVRQSYLRPLMRDGRLAMTNPEEPNDPQQAYRAVPPHKN